MYAIRSYYENLQVLLGKKIVENVSESTLSSALGAITDDAGIEVFCDTCI